MSHCSIKTDFTLKSVRWLNNALVGLKVEEEEMTNPKRLGVAGTQRSSRDRGVGWRVVLSYLPTHLQ